MIRQLRSARHAAHAPRHLSAAEVRAECGHIQEWLFAYLSTDVDPYDFGHLTDDWIDEVGNDIPGQVLPTGSYPEDMTPEQLKAFTKWLKSSGKLDEALQHGGTDTPGYLTLHAKSKLPAGTWFIHFTNASFEAFDRGTTLDGIHLSTWKKRKDLAKCSTNLADDQGLYDVVFGFAFDTDNLPRKRDVIAAADKYGRNAVLFQCDCAVEAYHDGDDEDQAIFPVCSEYNLHRVSVNRNYGELAIDKDDGSGEEIEFNTLGEVIAYLEETSHEPRRAPWPSRAPMHSHRPLTHEPRAPHTPTAHARSHLSVAEYAASFLASAESGADEWKYLDDDERGLWLADPRVIPLVDALGRVGVHSLAEVLGRGSFGVAARTADGHVVKLTADAAEVQVGATLVGKRLSHVVGIYGAWYVRGMKLDAEAGWDAEREEVIRKPTRVGVIIEQLVSTDKEDVSERERQQLSHAVFDFKEATGNRFQDFQGLSARQKREKLEKASVSLGILLRDDGRSALMLDVAQALVELRAEGIYAIDVHGGNVGWDEQVGHYRVFDVGVGSPPPDGPKPEVVGSGAVPKPPRQRGTRPERPVERPAQRSFGFEVAEVVAPPMIVGEI